MKLDRKEAARIAALAHLEFDDASLDRIAAELTSILDYVDQLNEVAVDETPAAHSGPTPLREDVPGESLDRAGVAANAPEFIHGFFVVPKVIGGEP